MVENILINEGRVVLDLLKENKLNPDFLVWYTDPSSQTTYLALGSTIFDTLGPRDAYNQIFKAVSSGQGKIHFFKTQNLKLISMNSTLGKIFHENFSNLSGDNMIGMFVTPDLVLNQVYAYGLGKKNIARY